MVRIKSFRVFDTAFIMAVIVALFSVLFKVVTGIFFFLLEGPSSLVVGGDGFFNNYLIQICFILLYFVASFIITACFCLIYNILAKWLGGIQIELEGTGTGVHS